METRKHLKLSSIVILLFAGFSLLQIVASLLFGELNNAAIPEGSPSNILLITKIILLCISVVLLIPGVYVGIKGLKAAKKPDSSKGHIVWATILLVLAVLSLAAPALSFISKAEASDSFGALFSVLLEIVIYFDYIKYAKAVAKEASNK